MAEPSGRKSGLNSLHRQRVMMTRLIVLAALAILLIFRMCPRDKEKPAPQTQPVSSVPVSPERLPEDDFSRYNDRTFSVVKVVDGDTIDVNVPDPKATKRQAYTRIRLWGIDTPEIAHFDKPAMYYGYEAAEFARKLMAGKKVRLELIEGYTRDKFGRLLAYVYLPDGRMYNALAVQDGYAYAETRFKHPRLGDFVKLEETARANLRGLWTGIKPDQLPHWYKPSRLAEFWASRGEKVPETPSSGPAKDKRKRSRKPKIAPLDY